MASRSSVAPLSSVRAVAVLDANVLFPLTLRDTLLRFAASGAYQLRWSRRILDEMERNLVATGTVRSAQAAALRKAMEEAFPDAMVASSRSLEAMLLNDPKDRHVVAAALKANASTIVTLNLRDFRPLPQGIRAVSPDTFLCELASSLQTSVLALLTAQAADFRNPPVSLDLLFRRLRAVAPRFVASAELERPS